MSYIKNNIEFLYRSTERIDPLWSEAAYYGGYKFIEVQPGIWLPRTYEYLLTIQLTDAPESIKQLARKELTSCEKLFKPSALQQSNTVKAVRQLAFAKTFAIQGYSLAVQSVLDSMPNALIYTDANYTFKSKTMLSTEKLLELSANMLTLIHADSRNLKSLVRNWGNVLVYNDLVFRDDLNIGGMLT